MKKGLINKKNLKKLGHGSGSLYKFQTNYRKGRRTEFPHMTSFLFGNVTSFTLKDGLRDLFPSSKHISYPFLPCNITQVLYF